MLYNKSRLIVGPIVKFFKAIFKGIYWIINLLNLQVALLVVILGVIVYFLGLFENNAFMRLIFLIGIIFSIAYAVIATFCKVFGIDKKNGRDKNKPVNKYMVKDKNPNQQQPEQTQQVQETNDYQQTSYEQGVYQEQEANLLQQEKPRYFRVKQNPNYIMAEYSNRYELYLQTERGLQKVRTDYKE